MSGLISCKCRLRERLEPPGEEEKDDDDDQEGEDDDGGQVASVGTARVDVAAADDEKAPLWLLQVLREGGKEEDEDEDEDERSPSSPTS